MDDFWGPTGGLEWAKKLPTWRDIEQDKRLVHQV